MEAPAPAAGGSGGGRGPGRGPLAQGLGDGGRLRLQVGLLGLELLLAGQHLAPQPLLLGDLAGGVVAHHALGVAGRLQPVALVGHHVPLAHRVGP